MSSFKKKKESRYALSKADIDFYKMTGVFALACIFVLLALKMQNSRTEIVESGKDLTHNFYSLCHTPLFLVIAAVAAVGAVAWFVFCRVKNIDESKRLFTSTNCLSLVAYLGFFTMCFGVREESGNHVFFVVMTIVAAALYYVSKIFNPDFVVYSVVTAVFAVSIQLFALNFEAVIIVLKILIVALTAAASVYFNKKIKSLKVSKKRKASFLTFPVYVSLAIGTVSLFLKIVPTVNVTRTAMLALLLVQYIVFAIVYVVKLIKE